MTYLTNSKTTKMERATITSDRIRIIVIITVVVVVMVVVSVAATVVVVAMVVAMVIVVAILVVAIVSVAGKKYLSILTECAMLYLHSVMHIVALVLG